MQREDIIEAYLFLRKNDHSIPDEVLDFMKGASLAAFDSKKSNVVMEWISVEDRLPRKSNHETTQNVLLWCGNQPNSPYTIGYGVMVDGVNYPFEISSWKSLDSGCNIIYGEVTHWMPLPEPPND
jgi:hypothetical protein